MDIITKRLLWKESATVPGLEVELKVKPKGGPVAIIYGNLDHLPRERGNKRE